MRTTSAIELMVRDIFENDYRRTPNKIAGRTTKVLPRKVVRIGTAGSTTTLVKGGTVTTTIDSITALDFRKNGMTNRVETTNGREKTKR